MLNTVRNVKTLEKHVGKEVAKFMKENSLGCENFDCAHSSGIIESKRLPPGIRKVRTV